MRTTLIAAAVAAAIFSVSMAEARLIDQSIDGARRLCVYELPASQRRWNPSSRTWTDRMIVPIGRGEPCPATASRPAPEPAIPSMAMLRRQEMGGGRKTCIYQHLGREYRRTVAPTALCNMTPN